MATDNAHANSTPTKTALIAVYSLLIDLADAQNAEMGQDADDRANHNDSTPPSQRVGTEDATCADE